MDSLEQVDLIEKASQMAGMVGMLVTTVADYYLQLRERGIPPETAQALAVNLQTMMFTMARGGRSGEP